MLWGKARFSGMRTVSIAVSSHAQSSIAQLFLRSQIASHLHNPYSLCGSFVDDVRVRYLVMKQIRTGAQQSVPCALTVAGSDSGGGAGIQTDLKTFAVLNVHGTSVVTCITAQNPSEVRAIQPVSSRVVNAQFQALHNGLNPIAVKSGMLFSKAIAQSVLRGLELLKPRWYVLDPVMIATSGARLLQNACIRVIQNQLIPKASLVTPNIAEAEVLLDRTIRGPVQAKASVRQLVDRYEVPVLLKGGHLPSRGKVIDYFYDGHTLNTMESAYIQGKDTHGTGCTYAAAITAHLARGASLEQAVEKGKAFIAEAIRYAYQVDAHQALNVWKGATA